MAELSASESEPAAPKKKRRWAAAHAGAHGGATLSDSEPASLLRPDKPFARRPWRPGATLSDSEAVASQGTEAKQFAGRPLSRGPRRGVHHFGFLG
jgi:hypothetical protein